MKTKTCSRCKIEKSVTEFGKYKSSSDGLFSQCKACVKENNKRYYDKNKQKVKKAVNEWKSKNRPRVRELLRESRWKLKLQLIEGYGGKCSCCGEKRPEFLSLDHVHNDGNAHRKELATNSKVKKIKCDKIWRQAIKDGFPNYYTILCMNCNFAKSAYGVCPHEAERQPHKH